MDGKRSDQPPAKADNLGADSKVTDPDEEFIKKNAAIFYKTTYKGYGDKKQLIPNSENHGIDGRFTTHLLFSGMYRNHSLNTTVDRDRYINGSKDWMEHLN